MLDQFTMWMSVFLLLSSIVWVLKNNESSVIFVAEVVQQLISSNGFGMDTSVYLMETTMWTFTTFFMMMNLLILFGFSFYCEFDNSSSEFTFKLMSFFFSVSLLLIMESWFPVFFMWEFMGFISFKLMGHWNDSASVTRAAGVAIMSNSFGDLCLLKFIMDWFSNTEFNIFTNSSMMIFALMGCILKSVMIFSSLWLTEAMEGPTPVSSLLHSCTLVMAGMWLWLSLITTMNFYMMILFMFILSMFVLVNMIKVEIDLKKMIALSTISLVSFIWCTISLSAVETCQIISLVHAGYKSLLFILGGSCIVLTMGSDISIFNNKKMFTLLCIPIWLSMAPAGEVYLEAKHLIFSTDMITFDVICFLSMVTMVQMLFWITRMKFTSNYWTLFDFNKSFESLLLLSSVCLMVGPLSYMISLESETASSSVNMVFILYILSVLTKFSSSFNLGMNLINMDLVSSNWVGNLFVSSWMVKFGNLIISYGILFDLSVMSGMLILLMSLN